MIYCPFCHQDNPAGITECEHCGATLPRPGPLTVTPELGMQIRSLLEERSNIEAIKWFREQAGSGLKEAKDAVEAIELGQPFAVPGKAGKALESELIELLQAGRKIEAIKRFRAETAQGSKRPRMPWRPSSEAIPSYLPEDPTNDSTRTHRVAPNRQEDRGDQAVPETDRLRAQAGKGCRRAVRGCTLHYDTSGQWLSERAAICRGLGHRTVASLRRDHQVCNRIRTPARRSRRITPTPELESTHFSIR